MEPDAYLAALERDGAAFAAAVEGNLRAPVTACPGWDVADLTYHLGEMHRFWDRIVAEGITELDGPLEAVARPDDEDLVSWYRDGLAELLDTLRSVDPATAAWTWWGQHDVAFIRRRMAHETAVHRWDAERAADRVEPIDRELAVDGIDEFLDIYLGHGAAEEADRGAVSLHLHATDGEGEWLVLARPGGFEARRGHEKGDAALRGSASDLLLALWHRVDLDTLDVVGDRAAAERILGVSRPGEAVRGDDPDSGVPGPR